MVYKLDLLNLRIDRRHIIWCICLTIFGIVLGLGLMTGPLVLRCVAGWWVVSEHLAQADAIIVLGGQWDVRPAAAADLYNRGLAPRIAIGASEFDHGRDAELNRKMLVQQGIPSSAIVEFNLLTHSTYGEARGILEWARGSGAKAVIIPVDIFQTRRVRWIFNRELGRAQMRVIVQAVTPPTYGVSDWWQHKDGFMNFRNELIKFAYYRVKY